MKKPIYYLAISVFFVVSAYAEEQSSRRFIVAPMAGVIHNRKWLKDIDIKELYNFSIWVTGSHPKVKNETVKAIETFFKKYIVDL